MNVDEMIQQLQRKDVGVTDELFQQLQANLADEIRAYAEQQNRRAVVSRLGPNARLQDVAEQIGITAMSKIPNSRWYALDDDARLQLAALVMAAQKQGTPLVPLLQGLSRVLPNWVQERPPEDAGKIPEMMIDPVTKQPLKNPWIKGENDKTHDFKSQEVIKMHSERLAKWLEQTAKNGGVTAAMLDELEAERMRAEYLRNLPYGHKEWEANVLRKDSGSNVDQRGEFVKSIEDPYLLQFHRREAELGSPQLTNNITRRMAIGRQVGMKEMEVFKAGASIYEGWKQEAAQKEHAA